MSSPALSLWNGGSVSLLAGACSGFACYAAARSIWLQRRVDRYVESLDAPLRRMLMPPRGGLIFSIQVTLLLLTLGAAAGLGSPWLVLLAAATLVLPAFALRRMQKKRREQIEAKLDGFALALANATRATPSVGRALQMLQTSLAAPLDAEVGQVLRETRIGSSLEQALLNFSWRVQSTQLDALLSSVLISRKIGGNLPDILETTARTLREMMRLEGVLRSKTAQARTQLLVLASAPPFLALAFNAVNPGHFAPFQDSALGFGLFALAIVAWIAAILLARKIMAVQL